MSIYFADEVDQAWYYHYRGRKEDEIVMIVIGQSSFARCIYCGEFLYDRRLYHGTFYSLIEGQWYDIDT